MGNSDIVSLLTALVRKESDIVTLYDRVLEAVINIELKDKLLIFQQDHKRHLEILLDLINNVDVDSPVIIGQIEPDIQWAGFEFSGQREALGKLSVKEAEISSLYEKSLELDVDSKSAEILDENLEDEQQHVRFFEILNS